MSAHDMYACMCVVLTCSCYIYMFMSSNVASQNSYEFL